MITLGVTDRRPTPVINQNSLMIGSSLDCEYIPFFAIFTGRYMSAKGMPYIEYCLPELSQDIDRQASSTYDNLKNYLQRNKLPSAFDKYSATTFIRYYVFKNTIFYLRNGEPIILMTLLVEWDYVVSTNYLKDTTISTYIASIREGSLLDYSKFKVLINQDLVRNPLHKSFLVYLKRYIFTEYEYLGVDFIYTYDTSRYIFKSNPLPIRFRNISLMNNYFEDLTKTSIDEFIGTEIPAAEPVGTTEQEPGTTSEGGITTEVLEGNGWIIGTPPATIAAGITTTYTAGVDPYQPR